MSSTQGNGIGRAAPWLVGRTDGLVTALAGRFATRREARAVARIYDLWLPFKHRVLDGRDALPTLASPEKLDWTRALMRHLRRGPGGPLTA